MNTILWESFDETAANRVLNTFPDDPRISVIDETWQRSKCDLLGLKFTSVCRQPDYLVGRHLRDYEPWEREEIEGDGNCLFRCFSKLISGSEESHLQLRSIISRFIASEGTRRLGWYFISKKTTPCNYLTCERLIFRESVWGTDVEILAASAILDADIYVANNFYRTQGSLTRVTRWSLLRAQDNSTGTLYITNYGHHYEPVINMLNSSTSTYGSGTTSDVVQLIE